MIKKPLFFIGTAVVVLGIITSSWLINQSHRTPPRAANTPEVKEAQTSFPTSDMVFSPATDNLQIGIRAIVGVRLQYPHPPLDGIQLVVLIRGNIPNDFTVVNPDQLPSIQLLKDTLVQTDDEKRLTLLYVTKDPSIPYQFPNPQGVLDVVVFSFTPTEAGSISFTVDPEKTKVIQTKTGGKNIVRIPAPKTYQFVTPTPTPTPTPIPPEPAILVGCAVETFAANAATTPPYTNWYTTPIPSSTPLTPGAYYLMTIRLFNYSYRLSLGGVNAKITRTPTSAVKIINTDANCKAKSCGIPNAIGPQSSTLAAAGMVIQPKPNLTSSATVTTQYSIRSAMGQASCSATHTIASVGPTSRPTKTPKPTKAPRRR